MQCAGDGKLCCVVVCRGGQLGSGECLADITTYYFILDLPYVTRLNSQIFLISFAGLPVPLRISISLSSSRAYFVSNHRLVAQPDKTGWQIHATNGLLLPLQEAAGLQCRAPKTKKIYEYYV